MIGRRDLVLGLVVTALAGPAFGQRRRAPATRDWSRTVTLTPAGTHLRGNPAAPHRLVEYLSYTCGHCAHFSADAAAPLARRVATGTLAVELFPAVRDALDLTAALLVRASGPARAFANSEAILAGQAGWMEAGIAFQRAHADRLGTLGVDAAFVELARGSGLWALMSSAGHADPAIRAALADTTARTALSRLSNQAWQVERIWGTPFFRLDGRPLSAVHDWAGLEPQLPR